MPANLLYAGGHDLAHPYLSPLFGDFTRGFPPTFLQSGTRDLFLSNTVRMHRALRAAADSCRVACLRGGDARDVHERARKPRSGPRASPLPRRTLEALRPGVGLQAVTRP